jgi:flavin-dependent dehydrogenase
LRCQNEHGEVLIDQDLPEEYNGFPNLYCNRGGVQRIMYDYAISIGVEVTFGARITKVIEDATSASIFVGDQKVVADVVIVADGVHSKNREYVTGVVEKPKASGFAVYRSWFSMNELKGEPLLQEIVNSDKDQFLVWIGLNTHGIVTTNVKLQTIVCFYTHKVSSISERKCRCMP